jgi:ammonia channel protein AmtB
LRNVQSPAQSSQQSFFASTSSHLQYSRSSHILLRGGLYLQARRPMLAIGAVAEHGRLAPLMVFTFVWATLVYDPIAHWLWNVHGWSNKLGGLDFAGGTPVHIASGTAALAISIYLRPRLGYGTERLAYKPNNTTYVCLGTAMMWFGWFGFNGGSALSANLRAANACIVTNMAASIGGLTWMLWVCASVIHVLRIFDAIANRIGGWSARCQQSGSAQERSQDL